MSKPEHTPSPAPSTLSLGNAGRFAVVAAVAALGLSSLVFKDSPLVQRFVSSYTSVVGQLTGFTTPSAASSSYLDSYVCKHEYAVEVLHRSPLILRIDNFLQPGEAEHMIAISTPRLVQSTIVDEEKGDNHHKLDTQWRTSFNAWIDKYEDPVVRCIEERAARFAPVDPMHAETLQVLRYHPGQKYMPHFDYYPRHMLQDNFWGQFGQRYSTVLVYMNDVEEGGHTDFPYLGLSIKPEKNMALFWYNVDLQDKEDPLTLHGGMPVVKGVKWAINISQRRWIPDLAPWHGWRYEELQEGEEDSLDMYDIPDYAKPYITSVVSGPQPQPPTNTVRKNGKLVEVKQDGGHALPPTPAK